VDTQTTIALLGICGTLGGALGGVYLVGRMERNAARQREEAAVLRAARLIDADLMVAEAAARICLRNKKWFTSDLGLTSEGWTEHRDVIASKLSWDDWLRVLKAVQRVGDLQLFRDIALKTERAVMAANPETSEALMAADRDGLILEPSPALSESTARQIEPVLVDLEAGRTALRPLTH
jgi:hypothetical protein